MRRRRGLAIASSQSLASFNICLGVILSLERTIDALDRLIDFGIALETDHHRIDEAAFDGVLDRFLAVFRFYEISVTAELHRDDATSAGVHRLDLLHCLVVFAL